MAQPRYHASRDGEVLLEGVNLKELFSVLRTHWLFVVLATTLTVGATAFYLFSQPLRYRALGLIRLSNARNDLAVAAEGRPENTSFAPRADPALSQIEVMRGRAVLGRVVDDEPQLRLYPLSRRPALRFTDVRIDSTLSDTVLSLTLEDEGVSATAGSATVQSAYGKPIDLAKVKFSVKRPSGDGDVDIAVLSREQAIEGLSADITIAQRPLTDVIEIAYSHSDPLVAKNVVNTLIRVAHETDIQAARQQAQRRRRFLEEQLSLTDSLLAVAQLALSNFRSRQEMYSSRDMIASAQQSMMSLDVSRSELSADRRMIESMLQELRSAEPAERDRTLRTLLASPGVASNGVITQLYAQLTQFETRRDSLTQGVMRSTAADPDVARLNAQIAVTHNRLLDAVQSHVNALGARLAALDELRDRGSRDIRQLPSLEANEVRLVQRVDAVSRVGNQLLDELQRARMEEAIEMGHIDVVFPAPTPLRPVSRGMGIKLGLALVLGLLIGGGLAFVREHLNTTVRRHEEVEDVLNLNSLALIPRMQPTARAKGESLANGNGANGGKLGHLKLSRIPHGSDLLQEAGNTYSAAEEAYRILRTNLEHERGNGGRGLRSIVITSAFPAEGKTTVATNLAVSFARRGTRVLLIDADMRCGRVHPILRVAHGDGLAELLTQGKSANDVIQVTSVPDLFFLPAGTPEGNPADFLAREDSRKVLSDLIAYFDLVIVDTPPIFAAADAAILGTMVDGVLLVVRAGRTDRQAAAQAVTQLSHVNAPVIGAVLNDPEGSVPVYGQYYYRQVAASRTAM